MYSISSPSTDPMVSQPNLNPMIRNYYAALQLFDEALGRGKRGRFLGWLGFHSTRLLDLNEYHLKIKAVHASNTCVVPLKDVVGTLGRSADFDGHFNPLSRRTRERWLSIASALYNGVMMPPVELIQVGERYFVRDGHHRVSAARACGQLDIDALITVWEVEGALPWDESAAACAECQPSGQVDPSTVCTVC